MADNNDAPFLGGFQVLADAITGKDSTNDPGRTTTDVSDKDDVDDKGDNLIDDKRTDKDVTGVQTVDPDFFKDIDKDDADDSDDSDDDKDDTSDKDDDGDNTDAGDTGGSDDNDDTDDADELGILEGDVTNIFKEKLGEQLGWDFTEMEEEPKTISEMVEFMKDLVAENSVPNYADDEVKKYDEFVKNGGDLRKFYADTIQGRIDTKGIDLDDENDQKRVIRQSLRNQGINDSIIEKRIKRYDEAGVLSEESEEALELVESYDIKLSKKLLEDQQKDADFMQDQQQKFTDNVEKNISELSNIKGIKITAKDKKELRDYILLAEADGKTKYQKDYNSDVNNLLESAYFTKNKDALLDRARKQGSSDSLRDLQKSLNEKGKGKKTKDSNRQSGKDSLDIKGLGTMLGVM
jgi:hypothetical protein